MIANMDRLALLTFGSVFKLIRRFQAYKVLDLEDGFGSKYLQLGKRATDAARALDQPIGHASLTAL